MTINTRLVISVTFLRFSACRNAKPIWEGEITVHTVQLQGAFRLQECQIALPVCITFHWTDLRQAYYQVMSETTVNIGTRNTKEQRCRWDTEISNFWCQWKIRKQNVVDKVGHRVWPSQFFFLCNVFSLVFYFPFLCWFFFKLTFFSLHLSPPCCYSLFLSVISWHRIIFFLCCSSGCLFSFTFQISFSIHSFPLSPFSCFVVHWKSEFWNDSMCYSFMINLSLKEYVL